MRGQIIVFVWSCIIYYFYGISGNSSVGRASASQAEGRGFESRFPLKETSPSYREVFLCKQLRQ